MKNLNEYITESLLDDEEELVGDTSLEDVQWVKDNYRISGGGEMEQIRSKSLTV